MHIWDVDTCRCIGKIVTYFGKPDPSSFSVGVAVARALTTGEVHTRRFPAGWKFTVHFVLLRLVVLTTVSLLVLKTVMQPRKVRLKAMGFSYNVLGKHPTTCWHEEERCSWSGLSGYQNGKDATSGCILATVGRLGRVNTIANPHGFIRTPGVCGTVLR